MIELGKEKKTVEKTDESQALKTGAFNLEELRNQLQEPERKRVYQWEEIKKTLDDGQAYVLPLSAKRNSLLTGIRREKLQATIAQHTVTKQFVLIPPKK